MVAFADVRQLMNSPLHDRFRQFEATRPSGPDSLEARTGIKFDTDIDRLLVASMGGDKPLAPALPPAGAAPQSPSLLWHLEPTSRPARVVLPALERTPDAPA